MVIFQLNPLKFFVTKTSGIKVKQVENLHARAVHPPPMVASTAGSSTQAVAST